MKILIITQTFPFNPKHANANFMYQFAQSLADLGHQTVLLLPFHPKLKLHSFQKIKLIPYKYIWPDRLHILGFGNTLNSEQNLKWFAYPLIPFFIFFSIIKAYITVSKYNLEVINAHWILPNGITGAIISKLTGKPLVISLHGSDVYLARQNFIFKLLARFAIASSKLVTGVSPKLLSDLNTKGESIPFGVSINDGQRRLHSRLVIATAGRYIKMKGFDILKKLIPDIKIISNLPHDLFLEKLLSVDIFIAPFSRDTHGNLDDPTIVVFEAMAAGCSVIAPDLPGYRQIIIDNYNGILITPQSKKSLILAINKLKKNPSLQIKLGERARFTVNRYLTPEKIAGRFIEVFLKSK